MSTAIFRLPSAVRELTTDVYIVNASGNHVLQYNSSSSKWTNSPDITIRNLTVTGELNGVYGNFAYTDISNTFLNGQSIIADGIDGTQGFLNIILSPGQSLPPLKILASNGVTNLFSVGLTGTITAVTYSGSGASLTSLNASNVSAGTLANARTTASSASSANAIVTRDSNSSFVANGIVATNFYGNGSGITGISATGISVGTLPSGVLPFPATDGLGGIYAGVPVASQWVRYISTGGVGVKSQPTSSDISGLGTLATQNGTFSGTSSGTNTGDQTITLTGDVTGAGTGSFAATIANDAVTYAKVQNISATDKILGRSSSGAGDIEEITCTSAGRAIIDDADASAQRTTLGLGTVSTLASDTDGTLATNSDSRIPTQRAVKTYVDASVTGLLEFKGSTDCSSTPNYPSASKGDAYVVSVAGKIGGSSGTSVDVGDVYVASADNAGGTQASVGSSWFVLEHNLVGALLTANNLSDLTSASTARTNLGLGTLATQNGTFSGTSSGTNTGDVAAASTTEVLTGTDATKTATSDSIASLWEQGSDVASATTVSLGEGGYFNVTGTVTITDIDFATDKAGRKAWIKFAGILTLTHNSSTLILPTGASITTAAGDTACFISEGSDTIRCVSYIRADGTPLGLTNDSVTYAKIQNISTDSLLGRDTAGTGDPENILLNATLSMDGAGNLQRAALTGDVTASAGSNATTIANDAVTYAKMQNVSATNRILGRSTAGSGDPEEITVGGDITQSGSTFTIANDAVSYAKIQNVSATDKVLGRSTSGSGDIEEITCTSAGRALIDDADAAAQRTTLGLAASATTDTTSASNISSGTLAVARGGTNIASYTAGDTLYASGTTTLASLAANSTATKKYLQSVSSGNPSWVQPNFIELMGRASLVLSGSLTNATNTLADATGFSFSIAANEVWIMQISIAGTCSGAGGTNYALTVPTSCTFAMQIFGISSSATAIGNEVVTSSGTASTRPWNASSSVTGVTTITVGITNSSNAGTVQLQFRSVTNGQTSTILSNSWMRAERVS